MTIRKIPPKKSQQLNASILKKSNMYPCFASARVNPSAVTEDITETPLEIAATNVSTKAFNLLAPHYEENTRKKISQLMIWALTEEAPSAAFMSLFESVPLAEVALFTLFKIIRQCIV